MNAEGPTSDVFGTNSAHSIFATVAALKALAGGRAVPIIPAMAKPPAPPQASAPPRPTLPTAAAAAVAEFPVAPAWGKDDLWLWRRRLGIKNRTHAAALLGMAPAGYAKLEQGVNPVRAIHVRLARYIEAFGPLPEEMP